MLKTWLLVVATLGIATSFPHPLVLVGAVLMLAAQQHALAVLAHEAAHHRLYNSPRWNDGIGKLCAYAVGISLPIYRHIHHAHHQHLYTDQDPDMAVMSGYPRGRWYLIRKLLQDLSGLTTLKNLGYLYGRRRTSAPSPSARPRSPAQAERARDGVNVFAFHLGLLILAAATGQWLPFLLWLVPLLTFYQVLLRVRALYEHAAPRDTTLPLLAARTNLAGPLARFFLFPHQVYFHIEHHLFPSIPHYHLAQAHRAMAMAGVLDDAEVVRGLGPTWRRIFAQGASGRPPTS